LAYPFVARRHDSLNLDRALNSADDARKLGQNAIAGGVDDVASSFSPINRL
jgi:hypothetical protein